MIAQETLSSKLLQTLSDEHILKLADPKVKKDFGMFVREFNKSEYAVRISKEFESHAEYFSSEKYESSPDHGHGFFVDGRYVPYFHPNRSFHGEIIYLNDNLYYSEGVTFEDKIINSALVKFYGPESTMDIITGHAKLPGIVKTPWRYVKYSELISNPEYELTLMQNLESAFSDGAKIWGTTELRTSLQTESRNFARNFLTPIDRKFPNTDHSDRKMRPSDMIFWLKNLAEDSWIDFYRGKPTMEESFNFLTKFRGIGNYYGYHFSSNLARMPEVGSKELIEAEFKTEFESLGVSHGNINENADYVMAGTGAMITLKALFPNVTVDSKTAMRLILAIRNNQEEFFGINGNPEHELHLAEASELGRFTTFGIEIACCQYSVFCRLRTDKPMALKRAQAPISFKAKPDYNETNLDSIFS